MNTKLFPVALAAAAILATVAPASAQQGGGAAAKSKRPASTVKRQQLDPAARVMTLTVGNGVNFKTGQTTDQVRFNDMVFKYIVPGDRSGMKFNVTTGQLEYQVGAKDDNDAAALEAAKVNGYNKMPDLKGISVGDANAWITFDSMLAPGRILIVRGKIDRKHYLVRVLGITGDPGKPREWKLRFSYQPAPLQIADAGEDRVLPIKGTLTFHDFFGDQTMVDLDPQTGEVKPSRFDSTPSRAKNGELIYVSLDGREIVIVGPDGKETMRSKLNEKISNPVLSPDGQKVAFVKGIHTYVVTRDGEPLADFGDCWYPTWAPDGRLVVNGWKATLGGGKPGLFVSDVALTKLTRIDPDLEKPQFASVSPDNKRVAFSDDGKLYLMNLDGTGLKLVATGGPGNASFSSAYQQMYSAWSPDGIYLAFNRGGIQVLRASDGKMMQVVSNEGRRLVPNGSLVWR